MGRIRFPDGHIEEQRVHEIELAAMHRAEYEIDCPKDSMAVGRLGGQSYRIDGCGRYVTYRCGHSGCRLEERGTMDESGHSRPDP